MWTLRLERLALVALFVLVALLSPTWVVFIGPTPSTPLAELQVADRRIFRVVQPRLAALEIFEVNLRHFHAGMAHEAREAVQLATAFQPGSGEGMAELVRGDVDIFNACRV